MRRMIALLILSLTLGTACYGAESEDMSVYVRKDVFDVHMQNIASKLDMILEEQKAQRQEMNSMKSDIRNEMSEMKSDIRGEMSAMKSEIRGEINSMKGDIQELTKAVAVLSERMDRNFDTLSARIEGVNTRVEDLRNGMYLWLVIIGTIISAILAWPKVKDVIQTRSAGGKNFTLEDVMRLIEENNAKLNISSQNK